MLLHVFVAMLVCANEAWVNVAVYSGTLYGIRLKNNLDIYATTSYNNNDAWFIRIKNTKVKKKMNSTG